MATDFLNLHMQDTLDIRDVIARYEELVDDTERDEAEFLILTQLLDDTRGQGGDEQWNGDWYPVTFVRDSYFVDYARELAEDIGAIAPNATWPSYCIDWEYAARELKMDYSCVEVGDVTFWYR